MALFFFGIPFFGHNWQDGGETMAAGDGDGLRLQLANIDNTIKTNIISLFFINNDIQYCVQSYKLIPTFGITAVKLQGTKREPRRRSADDL